MYKYFTTRFGTDAPSKIIELRKAFPGCRYAAGVHKNSKGIWAIKDLDCKEYGDKAELENGDIFVAPSKSAIDDIILNLKKYETNWSDRIVVKLKCGISINIFPASAIPKKVLLSLRKKVDENKDELYNTNHQYGRLAYKLYMRSQTDESLRFDDPEFLEFIRMAISESYTLPMELIDELGIISMADFDPIFAAAMGFNYENLLKELPLSESP